MERVRVAGPLARAAAGRILPARDAACIRRKNFSRSLRSVRYFHITGHIQFCDGSRRPDTDVALLDTENVKCICRPQSKRRIIGKVNHVRKIGGSIAETKFRSPAAVDIDAILYISDLDLEFSCRLIRPYADTAI